MPGHVLGHVELGRTARLEVRWDRLNGRAALILVPQFQRGTDWIEDDRRALRIGAWDVPQLEQLVLAALPLVAREIRG